METLIRLLYPPRCPVCHETVSEEGALICPECKGKFSYIEEPACFRCGKRLSSFEQEYCEDCRDRERSFQWNTALLSYDETARQSIAWFKYHNRREYALFYAEELFKRYEKRLLSGKPEAVVFVPAHRSRRRMRGYNQAQILAEALGKRLGLPVRGDLLKRKKRTRAQKALSAAGRYRNLLEAFEPVRKKADFSAVLLVDDIYTTGATMESCSRILKGMGIRNIYGVTICVGRKEG